MRLAGVSDVQSFPLGPPVEQYFGFLAQQDNYEVMDKYSWYASNFYVHIANVQGGADTDVTWPGGSCDNWGKIAARPLFEGRRIIDCEGFAFIASRLFPAAGWTLDGFRITYGGNVGQTSDFAYHIAATLTKGGLTIGVGSARALTRTALDEAREGMRQQGFQAMRMLPDLYTTQADAVQAVNQHAQNSGPLEAPDRMDSPRRSFSPPVPNQ